jgi:hypothetical protein
MGAPLDVTVRDRAGNVKKFAPINLWQTDGVTQEPVFLDSDLTASVTQPLYTDEDGQLSTADGEDGCYWYSGNDVLVSWFDGKVSRKRPIRGIGLAVGRVGGDLQGMLPDPALSDARAAEIAGKVLKGHFEIDVTDHGVMPDLSAEIGGVAGPLQLLINAIAADRVAYPQGVTIKFPPGRYLNNLGITVPPGTFFRFVGSGAGWTDDTTAGAMQYATEIRRSPAAGTTNNNRMFYGVGTGTGVQERVNFTLENMILCGRSSANGIIGGSLLQLGRSQNFWCDNVIFLDHEPDVNNHSVQIGGGFNGSFGSRVQFISCGADRNPLALDGGGFSLGGAALGFTAWGVDGTINFDADALHFEGGKGVHLFIGSIGSPLLGPSNVKIGKVHFERSSDSIGTNQHPHLVYGPSQSCSIGIAHFPLFRGRPAIWHEAGQDISNTIGQLICSQGDQTPVSAPSYFVEVESGQLDIDNFIGSAGAGGPGVAYCRRKSTAGLGIGHATYDDAKPLLAIA